MQGASVNAFGTSERPPLLGEVHCIGSEPGWLECSHSSIGSHFCGQFHSPVPDVVISCHGIAHISIAFSYQLSNNNSTTENTSCEEGEVRLRDGFDPSNGRVEYCRHRTWGRVCGDEWDDNDARVICRQLGYNPDGTKIIL